MLTRRDLIKLGLYGTGYVMLPYDRPFARVPSAFAQDNFASPSSTPFVTPLPVPAAPLAGPKFADRDAVGFVDEYTRYENLNTQYFDISAEQRIVNFNPGQPGWQQTAIWGYRDLNAADPGPDSVLGPTFSLRFGPGIDQDQRVTVAGRAIVRHRNNLPADHIGFGFTRTTVHLHGAHLKPQADGFPANLAQPPDGFRARVVNERGQFLDHGYPLLDPGFEDDFDAGNEHLDSGETPSSLWYHDHLLDFTGPNVYRGLVGFFKVFDRVDPNTQKTALDIDDEEQAPEPGLPYLQLPSGEFDIPLVLQDKRFAPDYSLVFSSFDHRGFLGDKYLVNGAIQPYLEVQRRKYRFRFLNGSNARIYQIFLADDAGRKKPMTMIATEGGLLAAPIRDIANFQIAMAERVEVVIDFSAYPSGTNLYLENRLLQTRGEQPEQGVLSRGPQLLQFRVLGPAVEDPSRVPDVLRPFDPIPEAELADAYTNRFRRFDFDDDHGTWVINGRVAGDLRRAIATSQLNVGEIWRLRNADDKWWHPIHIHSDYFRVITRKRKLPPLHERDGMAKRDTILLRDNDVVDLYVKFTDHPGPWVFHCHNLEHEDMAMMARFDTER